MLVTKTAKTALARPFVPFAQPCRDAIFVRREKRFLVLTCMDGKETWIHSNNTGSMLGLTRSGSTVLASKSDNPKRKLAWTQEAVFCEAAGCYVGVNTSLPNRMLVQAFLAGALDFAEGYTTLRTEVQRRTSRFDAMLSADNRPALWVECKNVTMVEDETAMFPDAASERGRKHLEELMDVVETGERAAMFYLVQRTDGRCFGPADCIDPAYAALFWKALTKGVEIYPYVAFVSPEGVLLGDLLPVTCHREENAVRGADSN